MIPTIADELDKVSADANAAGMIYSFYRRLSVASTDIEKFKTSDLPPTYFLYGTRDPFVANLRFVSMPYSRQICRLNPTLCKVGRTVLEPQMETGYWISING